MNKISRPILLVEDNPMDVDLTIRAFRRKKLVNPFEILRDGEEALTYIKSWEADAPQPVVILLDLKLPKVDGLEVLRQMKEHPHFRAIPIVILTTSSDDADVAAAYRLGANSYIVKPVDFEKFMEVAEQIEVYWNVLNKPPNHSH